MTAPRKPSRRDMKRLVGKIGPDDGIDPRELARKRMQESRKPGGRKTSQLCSQVARTLEQVFSEQPDDLLRDLQVVEVVPAPDESHLLVTVAPIAVASTIDPLTTLARLGEVGGLLRNEVAGAITRRRVPALDFQFAVPPPKPTPEVGDDR